MLVAMPPGGVDGLTEAASNSCLAVDCAQQAEIQSTLAKRRLVPNIVYSMTPEFVICGIIPSGGLMRLLGIFALACLPLLPQAAPSTRFAPRPQTPKSTCDLPPSQRPPFAGFDFCTPAQSARAVAPAPVTPAIPKLLSVCSIPLLNVPAVETHDSMAIPVPPATAPFVVQAPAPPCEDRRH